MSRLRNRPRPLRTAQRVTAAARYSQWMGSPAWWARRRRWVAEETDRCGAITCALCGRPWDAEHGDLHHLSYARLGVERHDELIAMCRSCHELLHRVIDASPAWQALIASGHRAAVTRTVINQLKRGETDE